VGSDIRHAEVRRSASAAVDLFWIPLGAGAHSVRWNGKVYEAIKALTQRRPRCDLYHSALEPGPASRVRSPSPRSLR
jgi:hypothetical protein